MCEEFLGDEDPSEAIVDSQSVKTAEKAWLDESNHQNLGFRTGSYSST